MPAVLTAINAHIVLGHRPDRFHQTVPEVLQKLVDPDLDEFVLYHYCKTFHDRLDEDSEREMGEMGFEPFAQACFECGIIETFLSIAKSPKTDKWTGLAVHFATQTFWKMMKMGTVEERRQLLKELLDNDALEFFLDRAMNAPLVLHRQDAVCSLRCLSSESFLGEHLSPSQTSEVITKMCKYILSDPQLCMTQHGDPDLTWQSFVAFGNFDASTEMARRYAPRTQAMSFENAAWVVQGLFLRCPPPSNQFCHDVLKHDPSMIDLLFKAATTKRPPWYAELAVDSILCEAIALIFRIPNLVILGVELAIDGDAALQTEQESNWNALLDSFKILFSRPKWVEMVHSVWNVIEDEKPLEVKKMLIQGQSKYHAQLKYDPEDFYGIFEYRGSTRICIERLIATLPYVAHKDFVTQEDLVSLLHITDGAVRLPPKSLQIASSDEDCFLFLESIFELYRKPLSAVFTLDEVQPPLQIANETYMGPTAHARLLTILAEWKLLEDIPKLSKLPKSISSRMTLSRLKRIAMPQAIRKFLKLARQRIGERREEGHTRFREDGEMDYACVAYTTAAELAASLISFNVASRGSYEEEISGVKREQVLCLGNAAEMALGQELYQAALRYAQAAVRYAAALPTDGSPDGIADSIREKNLRRVARAKEGLETQG